jgi:hypothetical protein
LLENLLDPIILCFALGVASGLLKSDLRLPAALYETLSIYLLLAIGMKGGVELAKSPLGELFLPSLLTVALGIVTPIIAYVVLRRLGRFDRPDAAAIAAHYGSVSAVTFAVVLSYLARIGVPFEGYVTVLLVVLEIPAIAVGILVARLRSGSGPMRWGALLHEVFLGKSIYLLAGGLLVGLLAGPARMEAISPLFFGLFKGALALFLLEMGIIASQRVSDLRRTGAFLVGFGVGMPLVNGALGALAGLAAGLTPGGTTVLATLAASASYIAAPAAMRIAVPSANPTLYLTAALGITFPFNVLVGVPIYHWMSTTVHRMVP